jgi:hypothetical protein
MPRKAHQKNREQFGEDVFLRSINLQYDAGEPDRIAHFQPTAKTVPLLKALLGEADDRAYYIIAPYGSGKSLTATYALQLVENRPAARATLRRIGERLQKVSPDLGELSRTRAEPPQTHGLVLALHGHCPNVAVALRDAAVTSMKRLSLGRQARSLKTLSCMEPDSIGSVLSAVRDKARQCGGDRITILWDEFGRHLEALMSGGRSADLADIQMLAEFVSRSEAMPATLGLFLHQSLLHYAGTMTQTVRSEWTKIEGRFQTLQYVDDSKEIYRLVAEVVSSRRQCKKPTLSQAKEAARRCKQHGLFAEMTLQEIGSLLQSAYPLEPVTLHLLPRLSARVAQNERTLFSFLYANDLSAPVGPAVLYDYFATVMRADTAVGGTYRQWLETQSALSKVADESAESAIKAACLLSLGLGGERSRAGLELLKFAVEGFVFSGDDAALDDLINRKLLLHRRHNDEVAVWHGTDADLRGRLEEEKRKQRDSFDEIDFLAKEAPPPVWRPLEYNDKFHVRRFLAGRYEHVTTLPQSLDRDQFLTRLDPGTDGEVLYVLAQTRQEIDQAEQAIRADLEADRIVAVLPPEPMPIREAALEVWCLLRMQVDSELVGADPLVAPELQQMCDDARGHLQQLLDRLVWPSMDGSRWLYKGETLKAGSARELRTSLSHIMERVFDQTPKINNEMIVRHKPSAVVVNARKKLTLGILERSGLEDLGIEGNFPDSSMFRCVLMHTGLYRTEDSRRWWYALPEEIEDEGLRAVWQEFQAFLTEPSESPKDPRLLLHKLLEPPYGVRTGLLPILMAAGLKAFPTALSLMKDGAYVADILPSEIESLCREPNRYRIQVIELHPQREEYLRGFHRVFSAGPEFEVPEQDLIRLCYDALEAWKAQLPQAALTSRQLSKTTKQLQALLRRDRDPVRMILEQIPKALDVADGDVVCMLAAIEGAKQELTQVTGAYAEHAGAAVRRAIRVGSQGRRQSVRALALEWAGCFAGDFVAEMANVSTTRNLLQRMQMKYATDAKMLDSLASLLVGRPLARWEDSTIALFERELHTNVQKIEESALDRSGLRGESTAARGLSRLVTNRIEGMFDRLISLVGENEAEAALQSILKTKTRENA